MHHEQSAAMAAESFFRINKIPAILSVTSGPGSTNAVTGVIGAWIDSIPMIIISGPGSGKTRVITSKIAYLISNNIHPSNILSLTFTNKSAKEMVIRAQEMIPNHNINNLWIGTFHSVFAKILRIEAESIGLEYIQLPSSTVAFGS